MYKLNNYDETPLITEKVRENLPNLLKELASLYPSNSIEGDVFLTVLLSSVSGCLDGISGEIADFKVWSNLYSCIEARGNQVNHLFDAVKQLLQPLHDYLQRGANTQDIQLLLSPEAPAEMIFQQLK